MDMASVAVVPIARNARKATEIEGTTLGIDAGHDSLMIPVALAEGTAPSASDLFSQAACPIVRVRRAEDIRWT